MEKEKINNVETSPIDNTQRVNKLIDILKEQPKLRKRIEEEIVFAWKVLSIEKNFRDE